MILITGGLGFVGSNTAQALLQLGQDCILVQRQNYPIPAFLKDHFGKRIFVESVDVTDAQSLLELGKKYEITGIVHLATGGMPARRGTNTLELLKDVQETLTGIAAVFQAAQNWHVKRVSLASAPVVYNGLSNLPWSDTLPLPMTAAYSMEVAKKCGELVSNYLGLQTHVDCVEMRLAAMYGPNYNPTRSSLVGRLVHAGVNGKRPNLNELRFGSIYAEDGADQCYIKDAARAIALLQTADKLNQPVYNIGSGYPTTNQAIVDTIKEVMPDFDIELPSGHMSDRPDSVWYFDITSLREDTGYQPQFDIKAGIVDYVAWLRSGNAQ